MEPNTGVYMIAYNDNNNTLALKNYLKNTKENRELYEMLLERSLGIPENSLQIIALKDFYWPIGTHYYTPLDGAYSSREEFIHKAQHPEKGVLVVGEAVSRNQGWTEGALESVKAVLTKDWVKREC
jgi:monoamine oxidase